jgi:hypothetical protein
MADRLADDVGLVEGGDDGDNTQRPCHWEFYRSKNAKPVGSLAGLDWPIGPL